MHNMKTACHFRSTGRSPSRAQRGVVMIFGLLALAIMMIAAAAMIRSYGTAMTAAGNLGFKRDLTNQAESALIEVRKQLLSGDLGTDLSRQSANLARNYSATLLTTNAQGVPDALLTNSAFAGAGVASNDILVPEQAVAVRYVVDRMCANVGPVGADHCMLADDATPIGGAGGGESTAIDNSDSGAGALARRVIYRISIRVTGPRDLQAYFQTTLTR